MNLKININYYLTILYCYNNTKHIIKKAMMNLNNTFNEIFIFIYLFDIHYINDNMFTFKYNFTIHKQ